MVIRPFEQWFFEDVETEFGIERIKNLPQLMEWLDTTGVDQEISPHLEKMRVLLSDYVDLWNEDELKMHFIGPFLLDIDFNHSPHYRVFSQRLMRLQSETVEAAGMVEWMVATGKQRPKKPFFFLHEYKSEKPSGNDPLGQLLIAMVDGQLQNNSPNKPIYGCYMIGRMWFFVLLKDKAFGVSRAYDSTQRDDMKDMIIILKRVKRYIHEELGLPIED